MKEYPLLLSLAADATTTDKIRAFVAKLEDNPADAELTMRKILLQDTLQLGKDVDYLKIQIDSMEA